MLSERNLTRCFVWPIFLVVLFISCIQPTYSLPEEAKELLKLWEVPHGTAGDAPPIIHEDKVIMSGGLFVYALEEETGEEIWKYQFEDDNILEGEVFLINGNQVAVAHTDKIRAWNISDGNLEWEFDYKIKELKPRLTGNHIAFNENYGFSGEKNQIFILDKTGSKTYIKKLDVKYSVQNVFYFSNKIYVGQGNTVTGLLTLGRITVLNAQNGDSLWAYNTNKSSVSAAIKIENEILYAGTVGNSPKNTFVALNAESGELIWEHSNSEILTRSFVIGPKYIYIAGVADIYALDKVTGERKWKFDRTSSTLVKPVYLDGYVYHSDHHSLFVIDGETGELVHEEPLPEGGGFFWHVAASSDKIFAQTSNQLIAYQPWHLRD
ncbi:MAG: PQQ-like beta-propeller repeat protein [Balneola sp.]|nr:PQQ-like beta-propeller repeat protein [Balneola sp.]MBO6649464.1 PQQ-like beta-propeller repeat protein [Balneola sp.]MBO6711279.1 PQQ-like beta-propeller repeat protein [Balneola sp.]MBO6800606.1 PQQ-like beta-propeller repeat protein [Balneola sp.]MBO6869214.1 PQQ-like beta-propeller repeat protein [Balneola sp.]